MHSANNDLPRSGPVASVISPLSQLKGATPANAARALGSSPPHSGSQATWRAAGHARHRALLFRLSVISPSTKLAPQVCPTYSLTAIDSADTRPASEQW